MKKLKSLMIMLMVVPVMVVMAACGSGGGGGGNNGNDLAANQKVAKVVSAFLTESKNLAKGESAGATNSAQNGFSIKVASEDEEEDPYDPTTDITVWQELNDFQITEAIMYYYIALGYVKILADNNKLVCDGSANYAKSEGETFILERVYDDEDEWTIGFVKSEPEMGYGAFIIRVEITENNLTGSIAASDESGAYDGSIFFDIDYNFETDTLLGGELTFTGSDKGTDVIRDSGMKIKIENDTYKILYYFEITDEMRAAMTVDKGLVGEHNFSGDFNMISYVNLLIDELAEFAAPPAE